MRMGITTSLDIREVLSHEKYFGLPTTIGRSKKKPFLFIFDRIKKRLSSWMERLVSWAGRKVLIKAVAQAIPTYSMSVFKFSQELCNNIHATISKFWFSRLKLCQRKEDGVLGFRDMKTFNDALLAK